MQRIVLNSSELADEVLRCCVPLEVADLGFTGFFKVQSFQTHWV